MGAEQWVHDQVKQGKHPDHIKDALEKAGYEREHVEHLHKVAHKAHKKKHLTRQMVLILAILVVSAALVALYIVDKQSQETFVQHQIDTQIEKIAQPTRAEVVEQSILSGLIEDEPYACGARTCLPITNETDSMIVELTQILVEAELVNVTGYSFSAACVWENSTCVVHNMGSVQVAKGGGTR